MQQSLFTLEHGAPDYRKPPPIAKDGALWTPGEVAPGVRKLDPQVFADLMHGTLAGRGRPPFKELKPNSGGGKIDQRARAIGKPVVWLTDDPRESLKFAHDPSRSSPSKTIWGSEYIADVRSARPVEVDGGLPARWFQDGMSEWERARKVGEISKEEYEKRLKDMQAAYLEKWGDNAFEDMYATAARLNPDLMVSISRFGYPTDPPPMGRAERAYMALDPTAIKLKDVIKRSTRSSFGEELANAADLR